MTQTTEPHPNYLLLRSLGIRYFTAVFEGQRRRCRIAEHLNMGQGYLLAVEGVSRSVGDREVADIEPSEPDNAWTLQAQGRAATR